MDEFFKALQIVFAEIDFFAALGVRRTVRKRRNAAFCGELGGAGFDVLGDFRKRGAGVGGGKFQTVILRGIVAGGEIDGAVEFAAHDFERDGGRGREGFAEKRSNAVVLQNVHGELREFFGVEARVVADQNRGILGLGVHVLRDGGNREADVRECEIVGD